jgi:hypothetical protein
MADKSKTEAQAELPVGSPTESEADNSRSRQDLLHQAYCADRAKLLLGSYRRDDANNPEFYVQAITMVLNEYPRAIVEYVTDPRCGIQSLEQFRAWPPNSGEVKKACDDELARAHRMSKPGPIFRKRDYVPPRNDPGCWANVFVGPSSPNYAAALAFTESPEADRRAWRFGDFRGINGIWLSLNDYERARGGVGLAKTWQSPSDAAMRAHYSAEEAKRRFAETENPAP